MSTGNTLVARYMPSAGLLLEWSKRQIHQNLQCVVAATPISLCEYCYQLAVSFGATAQVLDASAFRAVSYHMSQKSIQVVLIRSLCKKGSPLSHNA